MILWLLVILQGSLEKLKNGNKVNYITWLYFLEDKGNSKDIFLYGMSLPTQCEIQNTKIESIKLSKNKRIVLFKTISDKLNIVNGDKLIFDSYIGKAKFARAEAFEASLRRKMLTSLDSYVSFWKFDGTGDVLIDLSGQNNDIFLASNPHVSRSTETYKPGTGGSIFLNNAYVHIPGNTLLPKDKITVSLWVKFPGGQTLNNESIFRYQDSRIRMKVYHDKFCAGIINQVAARMVCADDEIETDKWYQMAIVYNGDSLRLYLNGVLKKESRDRNKIPLNGDLNPTGMTDMYLGTQANGGARMTGYLDNVYVWGDAFEWD